MMEDLQGNCTAGDEKHYMDPSLELNVVLGGQDGSKDVSLTVGERRLDSFEDIKYVSLEGCETLLVQFDATRAGFL